MLQQIKKTFSIEIYVNDKKKLNCLNDKSLDKTFFPVFLGIPDFWVAKADNPLIIGGKNLRRPQHSFDLTSGKTINFSPFSFSCAAPIFNYTMMKGNGKSLVH